MEILEKIFGSASKVKIMKLFIFNPALSFDIKTIAKKAKVPEKKAKSEIFLLNKINLLKKKEVKSEKGRKVAGFTLNPNFHYLEALREFLLKISPLTDDEIIKKLSRAGRLKAVVVSGVFIQEWEARADILVVGDRLKKNLVEKTMREIEAELGREISYVALDSADFNYRIGVGDKLMRDIFDYPHQIIFDKVGLPI